MLPAFISLVGLDAETNVLFGLLQTKLVQEFPDENCECFGDIVADWSKTRIGGRQKRNFTPGARFLFRWGLFFENIETIVKPAFDNGVTVGLARQFGYDVYTGAVAHSDCDLTLQLHWPLVKEAIKARGLRAPLYVFTTEITPSMQEYMARYFNPTTGQRHRCLEPELSLDGKVSAIFSIIRDELAAEASKAA